MAACLAILEAEAVGEVPTAAGAEAVLAVAVAVAASVEEVASVEEAQVAVGS